MTSTASPDELAESLSPVERYFILAAVVLIVRRSGVRVRVERKAVGYGTADEAGGWHA